MPLLIVAVFLLGSALATSFTSTILGPLTATFTQPEACTTAVVTVGDYENVTAILAQVCDNSKGPIDMLDCRPPTTFNAPLTGVYSPGLFCPAGHVSACSATAGVDSKDGWSVQFKLRDVETAVGCCPSGYSCGNIVGQTCTRTVTTALTPTVSCHIGANDDSTSTLTYTPKGTITTILAPMFQINWQSSDRLTPIHGLQLVSSTSTASEVTETTLVSNGNTPAGHGKSTSDLNAAASYTTSATEPLQTSSSTSQNRDTTTPTPSDGSATTEGTQKVSTETLAPTLIKDTSTITPSDVSLTLPTNSIDAIPTTAQTTTPTSQPNTDSFSANTTDNSGTSFPVPAMIGVSVGGGLGAMAIVIWACYMWQRRRRHQKDLLDDQHQLDMMHYESSPPKLATDDDRAAPIVRAYGPDLDLMYPLGLGGLEHSRYPYFRSEVQ